jgi:hypothetical protein
VAATKNTVEGQEKTEDKRLFEGNQEIYDDTFFSKLDSIKESDTATKNNKADDADAEFTNAKVNPNINMGFNEQVQHTGIESNTKP